ncbi:hypothetical protein J6590_031012 [Homalodisca vitripennis]|nr:hypothetical protein J6590_031012 [Homalodisca vitripennis]
MEKTSHQTRSRLTNTGLNNLRFRPLGIRITSAAPLIHGLRCRAEEKVWADGITPTGPWAERAHIYVALTPDSLLGVCVSTVRLVEGHGVGAELTRQRRRGRPLHHGAGCVTAATAASALALQLSTASGLRWIKWEGSEEIYSVINSTLLLFFSIRWYVSAKKCWKINKDKNNTSREQLLSSNPFSGQIKLGMVAFPWIQQLKLRKVWLTRDVSKVVQTICTHGILVYM